MVFIGAGSVEFTRNVATDLWISAQTVAMCDELIEAHRDLLPPALLR